MSPINSLSASIRWAPAQTIRTLTAFITNISAGMRNDMARLTKMLIRVRSRLASSNRCSSCRSVVKARMTRIPASLSFMIRFSRSSLDWSTRNFGSTAKKAMPMMHRMVTSATPTVQDSDTLVCRAR